MTNSSNPEMTESTSEGFELESLALLILECWNRTAFCKRVEARATRTHNLPRALAARLEIAETTKRAKELSAELASKTDRHIKEIVPYGKTLLDEGLEVFQPYTLRVV